MRNFVSLLRIHCYKEQTMAYRKIEEYDTETTQEIAQHIQAILKLLGEDPSREGLRKTPERVAKAKLMQEMFELGEKRGIEPKRLRFKINGIEE